MSCCRSLFVVFFVLCHIFRHTRCQSQTTIEALDSLLTTNSQPEAEVDDSVQSTTVSFLVESTIIPKTEKHSTTLMPVIITSMQTSEETTQLSSETTTKIITSEAPKETTHQETSSASTTTAATSTSSPTTTEKPPSTSTSTTMSSTSTEIPSTSTQSTTEQTSLPTSTTENSEETTEMEIRRITSQKPNNLSPRVTKPPEQPKKELNSSANYTELHDCSFVGESLICEELVKCFGGGEINCDVLEKDGSQLSSKKEDMTEREMTKKRNNKIENTAGRLNSRNIELTAHQPCIITGNIQCNPKPTTSRCKGRGKCHATLNKVEEDGMKDWIIAVICISIGLGLFLLVILIYVTYASWKKLRVQPQTSVGTSYVPGQTA